MTNEIKAKMTAICEGQTVDQLKETVTKLYNRPENAADIALDVALDVLMAKMPEADFVAFCGSIE